jgi:hypothetical protein
MMIKPIIKCKVIFPSIYDNYTITTVDLIVI